MRNDLYRVIQRPILTEKSTHLQTATNTYAFAVSRGANKVEIKSAVEQLFGVKVAAVRTMVVRGKPKRFGRFTGQRPNWKKAYVTLLAGERIDVLTTPEQVSSEDESAQQA